MVIGAVVGVTVVSTAAAIDWGDWQTPVTVVGFAVLVAVAIMRGLLIPRVTHEREIAVIRESSAATVQGMKTSHEATVAVLETRISELIEEKNEWRGTAQAAERVSAEVRRQNGDLLEVARTTAYALDEMRRGLATQSQKDVTPT